MRRARVAVIGAGPCGLAVARQLLREGHSVTLLEAGGGVGGTWRLEEPAEPDGDPLSLGGRVHSSMYPGLRVNLPRAVMSLVDFPFTPAAMGGRSVDDRQYPLHTEVLAFCEALVDASGLLQHVEFHTPVLRIDPVLAGSSADGGDDASADACAAALQQLDGSQDLRWRVTTQRSCPSGQQQQATPQAAKQQRVFDAVACCAGTFSAPSLPQVPGAASWPGLQLHAHTFRDAERFRGRRVLVVGASFSGEEIARRIADVAEHVYQSARTFTGPGTAREPPGGGCGQCGSSGGGAAPPQGSQPQAACACACGAAPIPPPAEPRHNISRLPMLAELRPDGSAMFGASSSPHRRELGPGRLDAIVWCTGYSFAFPFLQHLGLLQTDDLHVRPLFAHMFLPGIGPSLALCGLPWRCAKFPQFSLQGQLLARLLSGRAALPPRAEMEQEQPQQLALMAAAAIPKRYYHCLAGLGGGMLDEWRYAEQLVALAAGQRQSPPGCGASTQQAAQQQQQAQEQHAQEQQAQQQQQLPPLLTMPSWLRDLARGVTGSILARPDSFRDSWSDATEALMREADRHMASWLAASSSTVQGAACAAPC